MKQLICVTSFNSVGCTFLEWSINYLAGQTKYFNSRLGEIDLVNDPVTQLNAHSHLKNHPAGFEKLRICVEFLQQKTNFVSLYPSAIHSDDAAAKLGLNINGITSDQWTHINRYRETDYSQMLKWIADRNGKNIFVSASNSYAVYLNTNNRIQHERFFNKPEKMSSMNDAHDARDSVFFKESCETWEKLNLVDIWDKRERLALDTRPLKYVTPNVDFSVPHYWLDARELWHNGIDKIKDIMSWLDLKIDQSRLDHWENVYRRWQQGQLKNLEFQYQYEHIVEATVNGWSYPIDLTFDQEVVIQHCLIYQHNLNLKTWQLEKFPNNTLELHKLLEPNIHPVNFN